MLSLQPRQRVGHDILLARHGNHISSMRFDRTNDRVVALLDDGSVDSAPNLISPLLQMPETFRSILRSDWKLLFVVASAMLAVGALAMVLSFGMIGSMNDQQLHDLALSYTSY
ncbi:hypothetical protein [Arthrobacter sp. efr-133-R2A-63]|uniref:hypothetical protein n=1 Tax=Arthrobacter sp. efr-133-R2A-63 TaxID=3040278 RepID=UPI0025513D72|nr:hypothetical protein [Arthrobacter sp. efr-133-R2A-63]